MYTLLLFLFVINAIILTFAILMQRDNKGISGVSVFGQGGQSAFGGRETASFLHKLTIYLTVIFFVLAIAITLKSKSEFSQQNAAQQSSIIMEKSAGNTTELPVATENPLENAAPVAAPKAEEKKATETK